MRTAPALVTAATAIALTAATLTTTTATAATSAQPSHRRASAFEVTAKPSTTELVLGKKVTIKGVVSPKVKGKQVVLEQKVGDKPWKATGTATTNKRGHYAVSDKPTTLNPRKYRVVKPASGKHRKGVSKAVAVGVYEWHDLYNLSVRDSSAFYKKASLSIDAVEFPHSLEGGYYSADDPTGFIDFNLERQCISLRSTYGMADDADTGASVKLDVVGDGTELYTGTFGLLESQSKTLDLHGVFRLAFQYTSLTDAQATPAVASPEVLCSF